MERTQRNVPVFFSKRLFNSHGIDSLKRTIAQSEDGYLRMNMKIPNIKTLKFSLINQYISDKESGRCRLRFPRRGAFIY